MTPTDREGIVRVIAHALWPQSCPSSRPPPCDVHCRCDSHAKRILAALEAAGVRLVPAEATETTTIWQPLRGELFEIALHDLSKPVPTTKGMDPKARCLRLHAELRARIGLAKMALTASPYGEKKDE